MTLIVGFIHNNSVHIVADSVSTKIKNAYVDFHPIKNVSSFGEPVISNDEVMIEESDQKIYSLDERIVLAYSGNVTKGSAVLADLKKALTGMANSEISDFLIKYFKIKKPQTVSFIIGYIEEGKSKMFTFDSDSRSIGINDSNGSFLHFGSGTQIGQLSSALITILKNFYKEGHNNEDFSIGVTTFLQSAAINNTTHEQGVGGFFNGIYVTTEGVLWTPDSVNILCSSLAFEKALNLGIVFKLNLKGAVAIHYSEGSFIFGPEVGWDSEIDKILTSKAIFKEVNKRISTLEPKYYCVISTDLQVAIIVKRFQNSSDTYISFEWDSNGLKFTLTEFIKENLIPVSPKTNLPDTTGKTVKLIVVSQQD